MKLDELDIPEASPIELLKRKLSPALHAGQYEKAASTMYNILQRKREENNGRLRHGLGYYAMEIGRSFQKIDYRALAKYFIEKYPEYKEVFGESDLHELKIEKPDAKDTMGVKRAEMPQVATKDYPEFIDYLKDNGANFSKDTVPADTLKAIQGEFSDAGVEKQIQKYIDGAKKKPIIASSDDYIIDGHHRWLVALNVGDTVDIFRVDKPGKELLQLVKDFPKTTYKDIYTEDDISEAPMVAKQSHIFHVVSTLADRKDDKPFPIKFYDGGTMEVKPSTAKRIIDLYYRAEDKVKQQIMQYMPTYNGFKEIAKAAGAVQESAGVGKITKQNTTPDVKPGETERQAKKFFGGNGKPKPLGIKGATPHQAFNLGLTEDNISHVGTERGRSARKKGIKPGTDAWFKHWFSLPKLKRESVEMAKAELVEHVRLVRENDGKDYMHGYCHVWALKDIQKHPERKIYARVGYHYDDDSEEVDHIFTVDTETGKAYDVRGEFASVDALLADYEYGADEVDVQEITRADIDDLCRSGELKKYNNKDLSESTKMSGKELFKYFQTSHSHEPDNNQNMKKFMLSHNWELRDFTPDMFPSEEDFFDYDDPFNRVIDIDTEHRVDLSQPVIVGPTYSDGKYSVIDGNHRAAAAQRMGKTIKGYFPVQLDENFKDGKKPGRKGLAKRVGVDCSKPVGELRKIAKNSSGEKQRMAHWCANMKSGRKK